MQILFVLLLVLTFPAFSQTPEDSVKKVITSFFTGMRNADTVHIRKALSPEVVFQTIKNKGVHSESVQEFLKSVSKNVPGSLDERIEFDIVKMDGDLASVWTPYRFYFNGKFSHCGVNSFQLVRLQGVWKIQYIIDTRRKQNCEPH